MSTINFGAYGLFYHEPLAVTLPDDVISAGKPKLKNILLYKEQVAATVEPLLAKTIFYDVHKKASKNLIHR